jgi:hypothetical protein
VTGFFRDILETYRAPGRVFQRKLGKGLRENQLLAWVMFACLISLVARLPELLARHRLGDINQPFEALVSANMVAMLIFAPLFLYALAAVSHVIAHTIGGQGSGQSARLALFWTLIALQPLAILSGLLSAINAPQIVLGTVSAVSVAAFLWVWLSGLRATEWPQNNPDA